MKGTISIIIPVYNEEKRIANTVNSVIKANTLGLKKEIIIVDDGSTDDTEISINKYLNKKTTNYTLILIRLPFNKGKGAALKVGFARASGNILLVQDADEEYLVADYPSLLTPFIKKNTLIVYGSRNKKRENFHTKYSYFLFYIGGLLLTWFINLLYGLQLSDQPTGYKLFSKKIKTLLLKPKETGFSYEVALTAILAKRRIPFIEVPIHYKPRTMREGKKINGLDFVKSILVALKYKIN